MEKNKGLDAIKEAFARGAFDEALAQLNWLIEFPESLPVELSARFLRGRSYEAGRFSGGVNFECAINDYKILCEHVDLFGSDGLVGMARVLYEISPPKNTREIQELCHKAIDRDRNVKAMMILGKLAQEEFHNEKLARRWYFEAFKAGLPWGMRYVARSYASEGRFFLAGISHAIATMISPFLVWKYGRRSPFH